MAKGKTDAGKDIGVVLEEVNRARKKAQDVLGKLNQLQSQLQGAGQPEADKPAAAQTAASQPPARDTISLRKYENKTPPVRPNYQASAAPMQPNRQQPRPASGAQQGANRQGPYGRPAPGAQQGPNRQGPYGRPAPGAQQGPNRQGPYGRPAPGAQQGGPRPGGQGPQRQQPGGPRPAAQGGRPAGGAPARGGAGRGRGKGPDITPVVEKERVSNYDPNKKNYQRQTDPERANRNRRQQMRDLGRGGDDEYTRGKRKRRMQQAPRPEPIKIEKAFMTAETITVKDLTERIGQPAGEIIKKLLLVGIMATINQELDYDTASMVASEFGVELILKLEETAEQVLEKEQDDTEDNDEDMITRAPVVTIMGHVDHGKTSLLDYIRHAKVAQGEAGGITQHIGAYTVKTEGGKITFLDTPGHEAFTAMRARGAQATDIAILVVAADDGVMPQTIEAIAHAKSAEVPIIVAINKIDKPGANIDKIKQELTEYELVTEEWGGDTIMVPVSAKTGDGIDDLLENILLVAEVNDYRANPNRKARGIIIEARLDKGRGPVANVLVQNGTLRNGDTIVAGTSYGRVRAMSNDRGERVKSAGPSTPVEVIGFSAVPEAGDILNAVEDDKLSRLVAEERRDKQRAAQFKASAMVSLDDLFSQISSGEVKDLNIVVKADVQGSVEAVKSSLEKLSNEQVRVRTIHGGVGAITENDVMLASTANAIIVGFNVRPDAATRAAAERENVDIRLYRVIYHAIEDVEKAMKGLLEPTFRENVLGTAQVREVFKVTGVGTIAGCYVTDGKIQRNAQIRLVRDGVVIYEGKISSLKRFKDDAREVAQGYECGVGMENYNDIHVGDEFECFLMEEVED